MGVFSKNLVWEKVVSTYKYYNTGLNFNFIWDTQTNSPVPIPFDTVVNETSIKRMEAWLSGLDRIPDPCYEFPNFWFQCCPPKGTSPRAKMSPDNVRATIIYVLTMQWENMNNALRWHTFADSRTIECIRRSKRGAVSTSNCNLLLTIDVWRQKQKIVPINPVNPPPIVNPPPCGPRGCVIQPPSVWQCPTPRRCLIPIKLSENESNSTSSQQTRLSSCPPDAPLECYPTKIMKDKVIVYQNHNCCDRQSIPQFRCS